MSWKGAGNLVEAHHAPIAQLSQMHHTDNSIAVNDRKSAGALLQLRVLCSMLDEARPATLLLNKNE
jgi:hypothetical protein